jgi:hypothetical protein
MIHSVYSSNIGALAALFLVKYGTACRRAVRTCSNDGKKRLIKRKMQRMETARKAEQPTRTASLAADNFLILTFF